MKITEKELKVIRDNTADFVAFSYYSSICTAFDTTGLKLRKQIELREFIINIYRLVIGVGRLIQWD